MKLAPLFFIAQLLQQVRLGWGYSDGAPIRACKELEPGHGYSLKQEDYVIETSTKYFSPGHSVQVTVRAKEEGMVFIGVILQVRAPGGKSAVGSFTNVPDELQLIACDKPGDTVTHRDKRDKTSLTVTWLPPPTAVFMKQIHFVATFVQTYYTWNKELVSDALTLGQPPVPTTKTTPDITKDHTTDKDNTFSQLCC